MHELGIPRRLGHIWIGPNPAPKEWMNTWREKHPDWEYTLYDNAFLESYKFKTRKLIDYYLSINQYAGVADLMRYEVLYKFGGFLAEADSICLHPVDELFRETKAYTIYENEFTRGKLVSPVLACEPGNPFVGELVERLCVLKPEDLITPWISTGNYFVAEMIEELNPDIGIFPSYTMIPIHFTGRVYEGDGKVYAVQMFGTSRSAYKVNNSRFERFNIPKRLEKRRLRERKQEFWRRFKRRENRLFAETQRWLDE